MHKWKDNNAEFLFGHEMNMCNEFQWQSELPWEWGGPTGKHKVLDRVERIDSTRLIIDRLDFSRFCRSTRVGRKSIDSIDSFPTVYKPTGYSFFVSQLQLSSVFFTVMSVCLSQPWTMLMITRQLADMPTREITWSLCKNDWTDRVTIGVLIGLGQCHFVLDVCPIPNRPSVTFPGKGHS